MSNMQSRPSRKLTFESCEPRRLLAAEQVTNLGTPIGSNPTELRQSVLGDGYVRFVGERLENVEEIFVSDGTLEGTRPTKSPHGRYERTRGTVQSYTSSAGRFDVFDRSSRVDIWFHSNGVPSKLIESDTLDPNVVFHNDEIYAIRRSADHTELVVVSENGGRNLALDLANVTKLSATDENLYLQADGIAGETLRKQAIWQFANDVESFEFIPGTEHAKEIRAISHQLFFTSNDNVNVVRNGRVSTLHNFQRQVQGTSLLRLKPSHYGVYLTQTGSNELWFIDGNEAGPERVQTEVRTTTSLSDVVMLNDVSYFLLENKSSEVELWKYAPDRGHELVQLIPDGRERSLHAIAGRLHFTGKDSRYWTSDGSTEGTRRLDVRWHSDEITQLNESTVVFSGSRDGQDIEPWRSDGTEPGTQQIVNLNPHSQDAEFVASGDYVNQVGDRPIDFNELDNQLYFVEKSRLYRLPSSTAPPEFVHDFSTQRRPIEILKVVGTDNTLFVFTMSSRTTELWSVRNGTTPIRVWEDPTTVNFDPLKALFVFNNKLFFQTGRRSVAIWQSDGTLDGTERVVDLPSRRNPVLSFVAIKEDEIRFSIANQAYRLDLNTKTMNLFASMPDEVTLHDLNGDFVLTTQNGVWSSGDSPGAQVRLFEGPVRLGKTLNNLLFFLHSTSIQLPNGETKRETQVWRTDGTTLGTFPIYTARFSAFAMNAIGQEMYFNTSSEIIKSDGTITGTLVIHELERHRLKRGGLLVGLGERVYFDQDLGQTRGIWSTDGTEEGTRFEGAGAPGSSGWLPSMIEFDGRLFYIAEGEADGLELWGFTPDPPVEGDVDGDRVVDQADSRILLRNYGAEAAKQKDGDLNGDGVIDFRDFLILSQSWTLD